MFVACVYAPVCAQCMQEWKPRWGYKRVKDQKDDWMLEVPESAGGSAGVCVCVALAYINALYTTSHSV